MMKATTAEKTWKLNEVRRIESIVSRYKTLPNDQENWKSGKETQIPGESISCRVDLNVK